MSAPPMSHKIDKSFPYVLSVHTDISKTFERVREQQNRQSAAPVVAQNDSVRAMQSLGRALRFGGNHTVSEFE